MRDLVIGFDGASSAGWAVLDLSESVVSSGAWDVGRDDDSQLAGDRWMLLDQEISELLDAHRGRVETDLDGVIAAAGLEVYGPSALLRSAVVDPAWQGSGVGTVVVEATLDAARAAGVQPEADLRLPGRVGVNRPAMTWMRQANES